MKKKNGIISPCISVCTIEEDTGFCRGCLRTLDEIARWKAFTDRNRADILAELDKRRLLQNAFPHPYST